MGDRLHSGWFYISVIALDLIPVLFVELRSCHAVISVGITFAFCFVRSWVEKDISAESISESPVLKFEEF